MIEKFLKEHAIDDKCYYTYPLFEAYKGKFTCLTLSRDIDSADPALLKRLMQSVKPILSFERQEHGVNIWTMKKKDSKDSENSLLPSANNENQSTKTGDIFMTDIPGVPFMIRTADCACVVIYDPIQHAYANIHAGWRGIAKKAISIALTTFCQNFGSKRENLYAIISPMLGPCCAQFTDPKKELPHFMRPFFLEEGHIDLWGACENQLIGSGVGKKKLYNPRVCTFCYPEYFFSFRRDKEKAGRFGTIALLH